MRRRRSGAGGIRSSRDVRAANEPFDDTWPWARHSPRVGVHDARGATRMNPVFVIALALCWLIPFNVHAAPASTKAATRPSVPPKDVSALLAPVIAKHDVPGMAAAVVRNGETVALGVAGVRTRGKSEKIAAADRFHIGSDTKAMNAMLCGILVDEGKLKWSQTIGETFPEMTKSMHAQYQGVTLEQLLTHRGGAPGEPSKDELWGKLYQPKGTTTARGRE